MHEQRVRHLGRERRPQRTRERMDDAHDRLGVRDAVCVRGIEHREERGAEGVDVDVLGVALRVEEKKGVLEGSVEVGTARCVDDELALLRPRLPRALGHDARPRPDPPPPADGAP